MQRSDSHSRSRVGATDTPLAAQRLGGYWRVPAIAVVGGLVAFLVSFMFRSEYPANSRLLIRTGDTSYSTTDSGAVTGQSISFGGIDITKQATLGNTLVNLATSTEAATEVVKRIGVRRINGGGAQSIPIHQKIMNFLKFGSTGTAPTAEQAAVQQVKDAVEVLVLDESWVMEITAWDADPQLANDIADTLSEVVVDQSAQRFKENSLRELNYLTSQLDVARADVATKVKAITDFKTVNRIAVATTSEDGISAALAPNAQATLDQLSNDLVGLRARAQVAAEQLAATPTTISSRAADGTTQRVPNPDYQSKQSALAAVDAEIKVAEAKFNDLTARLGGGTSDTRDELQQQLTELQTDLKQAQDNYAGLNERFSAVSATVEKPRFDATRLGKATVGETPGRPLRYLFLLVGALVGALAGLLLAWFRSVREETDGADASPAAGLPATAPAAAAPTEPVVDVRAPAEPRTPVAATGNGSLSSEDVEGIASLLTDARPSDPV